MNETTKTSPVTALKNTVVRNKTRIAIVVAAASMAGNVVLYRTVSAHNEFLKEHDLINQFYGITSPEA